jgi:hypothetical protein
MREHHNGAHAATFASSVPASRRRLRSLLGGTGESGDSFPRTEVKHLDPIRIFRAALTSRSCESPHSLHIHDLTINPFTPCGPLAQPHEEQVTLVYFSLTTETLLPACWPLYCSCVLSMPQPLSKNGFCHFGFS